MVCSIVIYLIIFFICISGANQEVDNRAIVSIDFGSDSARVVMFKPRSGKSLITIKCAESNGFAWLPCIAIHDNLLTVGKYIHKAYTNGMLYCGLKNILGVSSNSSDVEIYKAAHSEVEIVNSEYNPIIRIKHPNYVDPFPIEELVGYIMESLVNAAEKEATDKASTIVVVIPPSYDVFQRLALSKAFELVEIPLSELMHDTTAAAYDHFLKKSVLEKSISEKSELCLFVNIGAVYVSASVIKFDPKSTETTHKNNLKTSSMNVLSYSTRNNVGGTTINKLLLERLLPSLKAQKGNNDLSPWELNMAKKEVTLAKEMLAATSNYVASPNILNTGSPTKIELSRDDFFELCKYHREQYKDMFLEAIKNASKDKNDITDVILFGRGSGLKFIKEDITDIFGFEPTSLDKECAAASGACLRACAISEKVCIEPMSLTDIFPHEFFLGPTKKQLFPYPVFIGTTQSITIEQSEDFSIDILCSDSQNNIRSYMTVSVSGIVQPEYPIELPKITIKFELNTIKLVVGEVKVEYTEAVYPQPGPDNVPVCGAPERVVTTKNLLFETTYHGSTLTEEETKICMKRRMEFQQAKKESLHYENIHLLLEKNIYHLKEIFDDNLNSAFISAEEQKDLVEKIANIQGKMYDKANKMSLDECEKYGMEFQNIITRMMELKKEYDAWPVSRNALLSKISEIREWLSSITEYVHHYEKIEKECGNMEEWINSMHKKWTNSPQFKPFEVKSEDLYEKVKNLDTLMDEVKESIEKEKEKEQEAVKANGDDVRENEMMEKNMEDSTIPDTTAENNIDQKGDL